MNQMGEVPKRQRLFYLFEKAHHAFRTTADRRLRDEAGVPIAQVGALFAIAKQPGMTGRELTGALSLTKAATSMLLSRMEQAALVKRTADAVDGRVQRLALTAPGKRAAERALPVIASANQALTEQFSEDELEVVARFFRAVIKHSQETP